MRERDHFVDNNPRPLSRRHVLRGAGLAAGAALAGPLVALPAEAAADKSHVVPASCSEVRPR